MSFATRIDAGKPSAPVVALVMILAFATICVFLLRDAFAPVTTPPAAGSSSPAAARQAPSDEAEAKRVPPEQTPAEQTVAEQAPREPAEPNPNPEEPTADGVSAPEQKTFRSRKALETTDPRELLRQGAVPAANVVK